MRQAPQWTVALALTILLACAGRTTTGPGPATPTVDQAAAAQPPGVDPTAPRSPIPVSPEDPSWGDAHAPVTVFYFSDLECPYCSRVHSTIEALKSKYGPSKLRIVFNHAPLSSHKRAKPAAWAANAVHTIAGNQAFWKFIELALANQSNLTDDNFARWAVTAGADQTKFLQESKSPSNLHAVKQDLLRAQRAGVNGTPSFLVNGRGLTGAQPLAEFEALIEQELVETNKLVASGKTASHVSALRTAKNFQPPAQKVERAPVDASVWRIEVAPDDPQRGSSDALVTIVMWSDLQCPFCARAEGTLDQLFAIYGDDLRVVWKDKPLPFHEHARSAAHFAREAYAQGGNDKFWQVQRLLFKRQQALGEATYQEIAKTVGLDWSRAKQALDSDAHAQRVRDNENQATEFGVRGTPHFFINGKGVAGAQPLSKFQSVIDERLADARVRVESGTPRAAVYAEIVKTAKAPPGPEWRTPPAIPADAPRRGPANAKVVLQVFSDFECPFCGRFRPTLEQVLKDYGERVQLVWRNLPLPMHANAQLAAEAAHEVYLQKGDAGFWKFHDMLFDNPKALAAPDLQQHAATMGVDLQRLSAATQTRKHKERIEQDAAAAKNAGLRGTPSTFVNGYFIRGAQPYAAFQQVIEYALKHPTPPKE